MRHASLLLSRHGMTAQKCGELKTSLRFFVDNRLGASSVGNQAIGMCQRTQSLKRAENLIDWLRQVDEVRALGSRFEGYPARDSAGGNCRLDGRCRTDPEQFAVEPRLSQGQGEGTAN